VGDAHIGLLLRNLVPHSLAPLRSLGVACLVERDEPLPLLLVSDVRKVG